MLLRPTLARYQHAYALQQLHRRARTLGQECIGRQSPILRRHGAADDQGRQGRVDLLRAPHQLVAIHPRQQQVRDHQIECPRGCPLQNLQGLLRIARGDHAIAARLQQKRAYRQRLFVVVDTENNFLWAHWDPISGCCESHRLFGRRPRQRGWVDRGPLLSPPANKRRKQKEASLGSRSRLRSPTCTNQPKSKALLPASRTHERGGSSSVPRPAPLRINRNDERPRLERSGTACADCHAGRRDAPGHRRACSEPQTNRTGALPSGDVRRRIPGPGQCSRGGCEMGSERLREQPGFSQCKL